MSELGDGTRVVRAGLPEPEQGEPFLPGPVFAAPFHFTGDPADSPNVYNRYGNPTWTRYEEAVGEPRGRRGRAVPLGDGRRGRAAPDAAWARLGPGHGRRLLSRGAQRSRRPTWSHAGSSCGWRRPPSWRRRRDGADLLWLETPSNPKLEVYDIAALTELRRADRGRQHHRGPAAPAPARPRRSTSPSRVRPSR